MSKTFIHKETDSEGPLFQVRLARLDDERLYYYQCLLDLMREEIPAEKLEEIHLKAFCQSCVLPDTWQTYVDGQYVNGIEDSAGNLLPATEDNYGVVMEQLPELFDRLLTESIKFKPQPSTPVTFTFNKEN